MEHHPNVGPSDWGERTYGEPCAECGYTWNHSSDEAIDTVLELPVAFRQVVGRREDSPRHPDLTWSAKAYVCHVADNLRIWAERLEAHVNGDTAPVVPYDENLLAAARKYELISWPVTWAALDASVSAWVRTAQHARRAAVTLRHPDRGLLTTDDVISTNCHDACHHLWDVRRIIGSTDLHGAD
jgi:hypothetical protein